jgi:hypothetical protein
MVRPVLAILFLCGLSLAQPDLRPIQVLKGHTANIFNATYSPDGKLLASGGKDHKIRLWNPTTGVEVRILEGHTGDIYRVLFSPDGKLLASAAGDRTVRLWDPATGQLLKVLNGSGVMYNLAFHPEGKILASSAGDGMIHVWEVPSGKAIQAFKAHADRCLGLAYSPDGKVLASAASAGTGGNGVIILWDAVTWQEMRRMGGTQGIMAIAFSPSGTTLTGACTDKTVRLWEVCTGNEVLKLDSHSHSAYYACFSPDGRHLASCGGEWNGDKAAEVIIWDLPAGRHLATLGGYTTPIWTVCYHPDGNEIASASGKWSGTNIPGEVRIWSLRHLKEEPPPAPTEDQVRAAWADLHCDDPGKAYRAVWTLSQARDLTLQLLREKVRPPRSVTAEQIAKWVKELDDDDYDTRETATAELEKLGAQVRGLIVAALDSPAPERRRRARQILERITVLALSIEEVHALRELDVLSRIGREARPVIERYTSNPDGTPVGTAARQVLKSLDKR